MLKGQARKDFEKWGNKEYYQTVRHYHDIDFIQWFDSLPKSCQYGVYIDWFDSVGIYIEIQIDHFEVGATYFLINNKYQSPIFFTRNDTRQKAIEQANKIYNDRK